MFNSYEIVMAETDYRRTQLKKLYPKVSRKRRRMIQGPNVE